MAMGLKAFESPLISHARMRAIYRGLVELRGLAERRKDRAFRGVEACWVAGAIDIKDDDLTCDTGSPSEPAMLEYIRGVGARPNGGAVKPSDLRRALKQLASSEDDTFPGSAAERLVCAVGSAMAVKADETQNLVLAFVRRDDLTALEWRRALALMGQPGLPLVVLAMPGSNAKLDLEALAVRAAASAELVVPVIPVDAGDAVAIYRVAQETMVRARAGGGAAVIEAVACGTDAVKLIGTQLVRKGICTGRWVEDVQAHVTRLTTGK